VNSIIIVNTERVLRLQDLIFLLLDKDVVDYKDINIKADTQNGFKASFKIIF